MMITAIPCTRATSSDILVVLRWRWHLERLFRLWKEEAKLRNGAPKTISLYLCTVELSRIKRPARQPTCLDERQKGTADAASHASTDEWRRWMSRRASPMVTGRCHLTGKQCASCSRKMEVSIANVHKRTRAWALMRWEWSNPSASLPSAKRTAPSHRAERGARSVCVSASRSLEAQERA
jgi:hypothetical protein